MNSPDIKLTVYDALGWVAILALLACALIFH